MVINLRDTAYGENATFLGLAVYEKTEPRKGSGLKSKGIIMPSDKQGLEPEEVSVIDEISSWYCNILVEKESHQTTLG